MPVIKILTKDGVEKESVNITTGSLTFTASGATSFSLLGNTLSVASTVNFNSIQSMFKANYEAIISMAGDFAGTGGYYVSKVASQFSDKGNLSFVGQATTNIDPAANGLTISDYSKPDIDCGDFIEIKTLLDTLEEHIESIKEQVINEPALDESLLASVFGVHAQYQATIQLWNYLVQISMVIANTSYQNKSIFIQTKYLNQYPTDVTDPTLAISLYNYTANGEDAGPDLYFRIGKVFAYTNADINIPVTYDSGYETTPIMLSDDGEEVATWNIATSGTIPQGGELTVLFRIDVATTDDPSATTVTSYEVEDDMRISRARIIHPLTSPASISEPTQDLYSPGYIYGSETTYSSLPSTAIPTFETAVEFDETGIGTYILTVLRAVEEASTMTGISAVIGEHFQLKLGDIELLGLALVGADTITTPIGDFTFSAGTLNAGDQFSVVVKRVVTDIILDKVVDAIVDADISWSGINLGLEHTGGVTRNKRVRIVGEATDIAKIVQIVTPRITTAGGDVAGGNVEGGEIIVPKVP